MVGPQHVFTLRSKDQGHTVTQTVTDAWLLWDVRVLLLLPAWDCISYDCLGF